MMDKQILDIIHREFIVEEMELVVNQLSSIELGHVWSSNQNLQRTRLSILKLAKGDLKSVIDLTNNAKYDFRDVIMWADEA
jgi:hypothetical protein